MNYLVLGLPKSGTSALHAAIKAARHPLCLFEPTRASQIDYLLKREAHDRLAKVMLPALEQLRVPPGAFGRTVLIVRDPRDVLVSWLLYRPLMRRSNANRAFTSDFMKALEKKEADPRSTSVRSMFEILDKHQIPYTRGRDFRQHFNLVMRWDESDEDHFTIRYEDYVDGNTESLDEYLGLSTSKKARVGDHIAYNERSKKYGAWKQWFTPRDEEVWRPFFQPFIERYGYERDWKLQDAPVIDPATSSEYLNRNLERLRTMPNTYGDLKPKEVYTSEYLKLLESAISDGMEGAIIELAFAYKYGWGVPASAAEAVELIADAADRGNPVAMIYMGIMHERGDGVAHDDVVAKRFFSEAGLEFGNARARRTIARLRRQYPENDAPAVKGST
jgi:hypothetical protein